jgi:type I restriction enzyme, S subunit
VNWATVSLGEIATIERDSIAPENIKSGSRYVGLEHIESGGGTLSFGAVSNGDLASNKFKFGPNHILFGKLRPYLAKIVCPDFEGICSTDILPIAPGKKVDQRYLLHFLKRPETVQWASSRATGVNLPRLSPSELAALKIPLPPPNEQRRIAAILDKADTLCRNRKRALDLLGSLTQSIFLEMFGSEANADTRQLSDLVDASERINYGVVQPGEDDPDGVFLVRVSDLERGRINHSCLRKVSKQINEKHGRSVLKGKEILISCVGSIGEVALTSDAERGFNIARAVARIPLDDELMRVYVAEYLRTPKVQEYFTKELRTVSQPTLNIKQISETKIAIPRQSELVEFERRAKRIGLGLKLASLHQSRADILFSSLQYRAFSGQL